MFRVSNTPGLNLMLDDLLTRCPIKIAKHLGVTVKTLERWKKADSAPKAALLALFYETQWGYSVIETTAHNGAMYARQQVAGLERENAMLRARIKRLEDFGRFDSANEPFAAAPDMQQSPPDIRRHA